MSFTAVTIDETSAPLKEIYGRELFHMCNRAAIYSIVIVVSFLNLCGMRTFC